MAPNLNSIKNYTIPSLYIFILTLILLENTEIFLLFIIFIYSLIKNNSSHLFSQNSFFSKIILLHIAIIKLIFPSFN